MTAGSLAHPALAAGRWSRAADALRWAMLGVLLFGTVAYLAHPLLTITALVEKNYNEGWNAYHAARLAGGAVLYDDDLRRIVNYPFLSFAAVAALAKPFGGALLAGRWVALLALLATGLIAVWLAHRLGASRRGAMFAGIAALGFAALAAPAWIATDDPQCLAQALMLGGLACYVAGRTDARYLVLAAALVMLGGFTKQTLVAVPLAITLDIALRDRRRLVLWVLLCLGWFALLLAATYLIAGGDFFDRLFSPRLLYREGLVYHPRKFLIMFKLPLAVSVVWLAGFAPPAWRLLLRAWALLALVSGVLFASGEGVSFNTMMESAICLAVLAGLALDGFARAPRSAAARLALVALPVLLAWPMLVRSAEAARLLLHLPQALEQTRAEEAQFAADAAYLAAQPGEAICESLLLCYSAGKELRLDPFNARQMMLTGRLSEQDLVGEIAAHRYGAIVLRGVIYPDPARPGAIDTALHFPARFTDPVLHAIADSYRVARISGGRVFYVPK